MDNQKPGGFFETPRISKLHVILMSESCGPVVGLLPLVSVLRPIMDLRTVDNPSYMVIWESAITMDQIWALIAWQSRDI
jgi:hypothetical protein